MKPTHLRGYLVLLVLVGQIFSICFVLLGTQKQTAEQFSANAETRLKDLADSVAETSEYFLAPAIDAVVVGQSLLVGHVISTQNDALLERYFLTKLKSIDSLSGIYFGRPDGSFLFVSRGEEGLKTKQITFSNEERQVNYRQYSEFGPQKSWVDEADDYDPRVRPWYVTAGESDALIWTDPYTFFSSGKPGISAAVKVVSEKGEHLGVIGVDVDISDLSEFIASTNDDDSGSAVIINEGMQVVAYSQRLTMSESTEQSEHPLLNDVADKPLVELFSKKSSLVDNAVEPDSEIVQFSLNDTRHIGLIQEYSVSGSKSQWFLVAQIPESEYNGGIAELFAQGIWVLIATVMIPGLIVAMAVMGLTAPVQRYYNEASVDQLTGALTRTEFGHRMHRLMKNVGRVDDNTQLVIAVLDLDGFKAVNDDYDHSEGDAVLAEVAKRLQRRIRKGDLVGRMGGDEFILAMRTTRGSDYMDTIESVRYRSVSEPIVTANAEHTVGMTAGIALWTECDSFDDVVGRADRALVAGKREKKNRCYHESTVSKNNSNSVLRAINKS